MDWFHRPFHQARDSDALLNVLRMRPDAARSEPLTLAEMQELLHLPQTGTNIRVWVGSEDTILGYAYLNPSNYLFFETTPVSQRTVLEAEMIRWGEAHIQQRCQTPHQPLVLATTCIERNDMRLTTLTAHGFVRQSYGSVDMRRSLHHTLPQPILPHGFSIRHLGGDHEVADLVALHQAAFQTQYLTVTDRLATMHAPGYELNSDLVVVAPDSALMGYCTCWVSTEENAGKNERVGYTDPIAIHPKAQGQGIGRALLLASCRFLADHGIDWACLSTSSQNSVMLHLAESVGFVPERTTLFFEKVVIR